MAGKGIGCGGRGRGRMKGTRPTAYKVDCPKCGARMVRE